MVADIAERWSLKLEPPFQPLSYGYVAAGTDADDAPVVLKLRVPGRECTNEIRALQHYDSHGMVRLHRNDTDLGAMLLERLRNDESLAAMADDQRATSIFIETMSRLRRDKPKDEDFPSVADWAKGFQRLRDNATSDVGLTSAGVFKRAESIMHELIDSTTDVVLLHGDLHHFNILSAERAPWLAIDPQGVVGDPAYDVGAWLRNPIPRLWSMPNLSRMFNRRVDQLVEAFGYERDRVVGWAYSQAVLATVWSIEEGSSDKRGWLDWAEAIESAL